MTSSPSALILFTKAPIAGLVKTRLITHGVDSNAPTAEEIAELYKSLLQDTLQAAKDSCQQNGTSLIVYYSPASGEREIKGIVEDFFDDAQYFVQEGRTVTDKVRTAFEQLFKMGYMNAALIPGDHPDLDGDLLSSAMMGIDRIDPIVILGPTFDGGAYLLGFNRASFERIKFSLDNTYLVCADIFLRSKDQGIPCRFLDNRNDIDDWDDARYFLKSQRNPNGRARAILQKLVPRVDHNSNDGKGLSIVIPTLNEEKEITTLLDCLDGQTEKDFETILVDGSSADETIRKSWDRVNKIAFVGTPSRKVQENVGAVGAKGKALLFLHADSIVSDTLCESVLKRMDEPDRILGGSCRAIFDGTGTKFSFLNAVRKCGSELLNIHGISSGFFIRRTAFLTANGFRTDVMEEAVDFQRRVSSWGRFVTLKEYVTSSSRRFRSKKTFVPTVAVWITTVVLTAVGLHFNSIEKKLWRAVR